MSYEKRRYTFSFIIYKNEILNHFTNLTTK